MTSHSAFTVGRAVDVADDRRGPGCSSSHRANDRRGQPSASEQPASRSGTTTMRVGVQDLRRLGHEVDAAEARSRRRPSSAPPARAASESPTKSARSWISRLLVVVGEDDGVALVLEAQDLLLEVVGERAGAAAMGGGPRARHGVRAKIALSGAHAGLGPDQERRRRRGRVAHACRRACRASRPGAPARRRSRPRRAARARRRRRPRGRRGREAVGRGGSRRRAEAARDLDGDAARRGRRARRRPQLLEAAVEGEAQAEAVAVERARPRRRRRSGTTTWSRAWTAAARAAAGAAEREQLGRRAVLDREEARARACAPAGGTRSATGAGARLDVAAEAAATAPGSRPRAARGSGRPRRRRAEGERHEALAAGGEPAREGVRDGAGSRRPASSSR